MRRRRVERMTEAALAAIAAGAFQEAADAIAVPTVPRTTAPAISATLQRRTVSFMIELPQAGRGQLEAGRAR